MPRRLCGVEWQARAGERSGFSGRYQGYSQGLVRRFQFNFCPICSDIWSYGPTDEICDIDIDKNVKVFSSVIPCDTYRYLRGCRSAFPGRKCVDGTHWSVSGCGFGKIGTQARHQWFELWQNSWKKLEVVLVMWNGIDSFMMIHAEVLKNFSNCGLDWNWLR